MKPLPSPELSLRDAWAVNGVRGVLHVAWARWRRGRGW